MSRLHVDTLRQRARVPLRKAARQDASDILREAARQDRRTQHDVFLSHSHLDIQAVLGLKTTLEGAGHSVYVDSQSDPQVDPTNVTASTVALVRRRLDACSSLLYATSENAATSKWMAWELGLGDGLGKRVAIVPVSGMVGALTAREFLLAYAQVEEASDTLLVREPGGLLTTFEHWLRAA
ncbi:MAG: toll/interleukin-1 receptor domain-containing protein [Deltaproteobacteria bacterium]|nr:toll/interleukin-1 receptor domain-containing protein [Deltaproteobacteria bacterium]